MTFHPAPEVVVEDTAHTSPPLPEKEPKSLLSNLPEIRSVKIKGLGLKTLKKSLSIFSDPSMISYPEDLQGPPEEIAHAHAFLRQERLEQDTLNSALDRWRTEHTLEMKQFGTNGHVQGMGSLIWEWHVALTPLLKEEIRNANEAETKEFKGEVDQDRCHYGPFLQYLSPEKLSAVTILSTLSTMSSYGVDKGCKISTLVVRLGNAIQDESIAESMMNDRNPGIWKDLSPQDRSMKLAYLIKKKQPHDSLAKMIYDTDTSNFIKRDQAWPLAIKVKVGAVLLSCLIQAAKMKIICRSEETEQVLNEIQPAFCNGHQYISGKRVGMIRMNAALSTKLSREPVSSALSKNLPMVVEPLPWTGFKQGGFIRYPKSVVRIGPGQEQLRRYIRAASDHGDMAQVFASLDVLGKTPWRINRGVFDVMVEAWSTGERVADLAPENPQYEYPVEPESSEDSQARKQWAYRLREINNERSSFHSQRCFQNFILEVARAYRKETFYFPHNVDFRGRAYPIPPYLNHMGSDNCRGLLIFAKGKELGTAGLTWLKVHLANVFGFDKASFDERKDFTTNHLSDVYDSATRPLDGDKWWLEAEDPWQCLAACMELKNALESPDPAKFVSHLPIHQDGTCNGLQHYAALGGDAVGAKQVNLEPGDRPSDIYTAVANMVKAEVAVDAAQGSELARLLDGKLTRKVVKQTVMTNVYGVTFNGAKSQVKKQLQELLPDFPRTDKINYLSASRYIVLKIFKALSAMFNGAHAIQYWLGECASRICEALSPDQLEWIENNASGKVESSAYSSRPTNEAKNKDEQMRFKTSVIWTTPLKMPVVQPYRTATRRSISTRLQKLTISEPGASDIVSKRKQLQAFPPNFIHSLDATHMMLSALKCDELGMSFAAVHDSFWTHAADVDTMNSVLRDAFIKMHSENIIGRLAAEFSARYKDYVYLAPIKLNSALGKRIKNLRHQMNEEAKGRRAQQCGKIDELLMERRRMRLLASTDPAERLQGESIMTPSRLVAETANEDDFVPLELLENGIGEVSSATANGIEHGEDDVDEFEDAGESKSEVTIEDALVEGPKPTDDVGDLAAQKRAKINRSARLNRKIWVWAPLTFPPVPPKVCLDFVHRPRISTDPNCRAILMFQGSRTASTFSLKVRVL